MTKPMTPRAIAWRCLCDIEQKGAWSDGALHFYLDQGAYERRDTALASQLCYGTLQNRNLCDFYIRQYASVRLGKIEIQVLQALRMAVYQLTILSKIPAHAAVNETLQILKQYTRVSPKVIGFVNGVLRSIARAVEKQTLPKINTPTKEAYYALQYSHPLWLVQMFAEQWNTQTAGEICRANNETPPLSLRVTKASPYTTEELVEQLQTEGIEAVRHPTIAQCILCRGGDVRTFTCFRQGYVTVQDGASMVCAELLDVQPYDQVLDCCAAPGGKTFFLAEKLQGTGAIHSCDLYAHKLEKIQQGAHRLGLTGIHTHCMDARVAQPAWLRAFDKVLCDVPCSGMGIIRKKPEIRYKEESTLAELPVIQQQILETCAEYVREGGTLLYSTCTILERENADVVTSFLHKRSDFELSPFFHPVCGEQPTGMVTLLPHMHQTDGFFMAKMRRIR